MKAQVIVCKCGAKFAACIEPHCYTDKDWQKDLRKYVKSGCSVQLLECSSFKLEECMCNKKDVEPNLFN